VTSRLGTGTSLTFFTVNVTVNLLLDGRRRRRIKVMEEATLICCRHVWVRSPSPDQLISDNGSPLQSLLILFSL